jgi:hypothetical protein
LKYNTFQILCAVSLAITGFIVNQNLVYSQVFTKITDPNNPIVTESISANFIGASWVDIDNDDRLDLFICGKDIYKNLGDGNFAKLTSSVPQQGNVIGNTWADVNNDGYIDLFLSSTTQANPSSHLFINNGNGTFSKVTGGSIGDSVSNTGWGCSFGDFNNDGWPDLVIAAAYGFGTVLHNNRLFVNNGDGTFTSIDTTAVTAVHAPYTIPTWSDYDMDGDIDLFIGSGPATGTPARDYLFRNFLTEFNTPYLQRIDTSIIGTDLVDGQTWNWIDYDNDGDLDAFLTNYSPNVHNRLYRCDGLRYYTKMTEAQVGTIVSDPGYYLTNLWGDFDNDGDLDCFVTRGSGQSSYYYMNNGDGTFTRVDTLAIVTGPGPCFGASAGDYDNDGDLDLFVAGNTTTKGLYRNDTQNGNKWVNIKCVGGSPAAGLSNISALGTIVKAKAIINGISTWQIREINAQNSFNSMNALNVHFGFGNASVIDSLIIRWPRGLVQVYTNVAVNKFYRAIEGQGLNEIIIGINKTGTTIPEQFNLYQNYPNPFNPSTKIKFDIPSSPLSLGEGQGVKLVIYDILGREVSVLVNQQLKPGTYEINWNAAGYPSGAYFYKLVVSGAEPLTDGNFTESKKMILVK